MQKKKLKKAKAEEEDHEHVMSIAKWKKTHILREYTPKDEMGNLVVPATWLDTVMDTFGARQLYEKHVKEMYMSVQRGILDIKVVVLLFKNEVVDAGLDPLNMNIGDLDEKPEGLHWYVIVGAHTVAAVQRHHSERPNNRLYKNISCQVIVCDDTPENREYARDYGTLENNLRAIGKNSSGWDILWQLRQLKLQFDEMHGTKKDKQKWYQSQKNKLAMDHNIDKDTTMGNYNSIACLRVSLFNKVRAIFEGKVAVDNFTPPTAITPFREMSGVPDDDKEVLLSHVIGGIINLKEFKKKCMYIKKEGRVKNQILEFLQEINPDVDIPDWDTAIDMYDFLDNEYWFTNIMGWVGSVAKEGLGSKLKMEIREQLQKLEDSKKPVCTHCMFEYFHCCHVLILCITIGRGHRGLL